MGYFSNGTEGDIYRDEYCLKCKNWARRPGEPIEGCPVMDLHFTDNRNPAAREYLDFFIPPTKFNGIPTNGKCRMFLPKE